MSPELARLFKDIRSLLASFGNRDLAKSKEQRNISQHNMQLRAGLMIDIDEALRLKQKNKDTKAILCLRFPYPESILNDIKNFYSCYYDVELVKKNKSKFIVLTDLKTGGTK